MSGSYIPIRIIIADDHEIYRDGFKVMLKKQTAIELIGETDSGEGLIQMAHYLRPDIVITNIKLPLLDGISAAKQLTAQLPEIGIIALSVFDDETFILDMLEAGAKGYLMKSAEKEEMINAIKAVHKGQNYFCNLVSRKLTKMLADSTYHPHKKNAKPELTERELSVTKFICQELSNKEIATELKLSVRTVEGYREKIQEKIGARNTAGIVIYAIRNKIFNI